MKKLTLFLSCILAASFVQLPVMAEETVINVIKYGANGYDDKDDTTAINNAIKDVLSTPDSVLQIPSGTYKVNAGCFSLNGVENLTVRTGASGVTFKGSGPLMNINNCKNINFGAFTFNNMGTASAIEIKDSENCTFDAVTVGGNIIISNTDTYETALDIDKENNITFNNISINSGRLIMNNLGGVQIDSLQISNPTGTVIEGNMLKGVSLESVQVTGNGTGVDIKNIYDFHIGDYKSTDANFVIDGNTVNTGDYDLNLSIGSLDVEGGTIQLKKIKGMKAGSIKSSDSLTDGIYIENTSDFTVGKITVNNANASKSEGVIRGLLFNNCQNANVNEYYITMDEDVNITSVEFGGGTENGVTKDINVFYMGYINNHARDAHDIVYQGGPYAPVNANLYAEYICMGEAEPEFRSISQGFLPDGGAYKLDFCNVSVEENVSEISGKITDKYGFGDTLTVFAVIYDKDDICIAKTMKESVFDEEFSLSLDVPDDAEKIVVYFWDSIGGMNRVVDNFIYKINQ